MGMIYDSDGEPWAESRKESFIVGGKEDSVEFHWKDFFELLHLLEAIRPRYIAWRTREDEQ